MDGLLRIHRLIHSLDNDSPNATSGARGTVITRLLVADSQTRSLIGWQGSNIKSSRDDSNCSIRIQREHLPVFALKYDSVVEIKGKPTGVHTAVERIASHLRKFSVDQRIVKVFEKRVSLLILML
ncbi:hypothetical protein REPUB_Repub17cG0083200 [Reevesia pubescens]